MQGVDAGERSEEQVPPVEGHEDHHQRRGRNDHARGRDGACDVRDPSGLHAERNRPHVQPTERRSGGEVRCRTTDI